MAITRIIGIDPGSRLTGFGIIDVQGQVLRHVASGVIRVQGDALPAKLGYIFEQLSVVIAEHQPAEMSIENVFMAKNPDSALKLGQARGAAICAGVARGVQVHEYTPREVKLALVGKGGADKQQVQHMVAAILNLPPASLQADEADALAMAVCHSHHRSTLGKLASALPSELMNQRRWSRRR